MDTSKTKQFETFYKQFIIRRYKKGETLIRADDDPQGIFCLTKGYVRQIYNFQNGFRAHTTYIKTHHIFSHGLGN